MMRFRAALEATRLLAGYWRIVLANTSLEYSRRHAGALLGRAWTVLFPVLLLSVYLFVYLVIFRVRFPGYGQLDYVVYVFAGLVPYIGLMDAVNNGVNSVRNSMHLVRNIILPIELLAFRVVLVSLVPQLVGLLIVIVLTFINGTAGLSLLFLPVALLLQCIFQVGVVWVVSAAGALILDLGQVLGLLLLLLLFISPIAYRPEMVPSGYDFLVHMNPIYYLAEMYRFALITNNGISPMALIVVFVGALTSYIIGATVFRRVKTTLVDF